MKTIIGITFGLIGGILLIIVVLKALKQILVNEKITKNFTIKYVIIAVIFIVIGGLIIPR